MLKLRFSKPSVRTYMDGKVTVCKYDCTLIDGNTKTIVEKFSVKGTSKCAPSDNVDADFGRKLADSRAKFEAYKVASNMVDPECIKCMIEEIKCNYETIDFIETMQYLKRKEADHINYLHNELSA